MSPATRRFRIVSPSSTGDQIVARLDGRGSRLYFPGETLAGSYYLNEIRGAAIDVVEISVFWRTEGKGTEDSGVCAFWRLSSQDDDWIDPLQPGRFSVVLPNSPLSYEGNTIKIRWAVRVRAETDSGRRFETEIPFRLGNLPDMRTFKAAPEPFEPRVVAFDRDETSGETSVRRPFR